MKLLKLFILLCLGATASAQSVQWNYGTYYKWHRLYDKGNYAIGERSVATARGFGILSDLTIAGHFTIEGSYNLSLARNFNDFTLSQYRYFYHQLDLNFQFHLPIKSGSTDPYMYVGYGWDFWESSAYQSLRNFALHNNFGAGINIALRQNLKIFYQFDFALMHNEQYQHNFHNQLGLRFNIQRPDAVQGMEDKIEIHIKPDSSCYHAYDSLLAVQQLSDEMYLKAMARMISKYAAQSEDNKALMTVILQHPALLDSFVQERKLIINGSANKFFIDSTETMPVQGYYLRVDQGVDTNFIGRYGLGQPVQVLTTGRPLQFLACYVSADKQEAVFRLIEMRSELPNLQLIQF